MNMIPDDDTAIDLRGRLEQLKTATAAMRPPHELEAALLDRLFPHSSAPTLTTGIQRRAIPLPPRPVRGTPSLAERWAAWIAWPVSVAAATALCSWMVFTNPAVAPEVDAALLADGSSAETATPFMALAAFDDFPAGMRGEVVNARLPRSTLAEFGLPVSPMRAAEPINAEFLVGPNGGVLAVRFVDDAGR